MLRIPLSGSRDLWAPGGGSSRRTGWADGNIEPWDFTDLYCLAINGKTWGRAADLISQKLLKPLCAKAA